MAAFAAAFGSFALQNLAKALSRSAWAGGRETTAASVTIARNAFTTRQLCRVQDVSKPDDVTSVSWIGAGWLFPPRSERRRESANSCRTESACRSADLVEDLWTQPDVALRAAAGARLGKRDSFTVFRELFEEGDGGAGDLSGEGSAVGGRCSSFRSSLAALGLDRLPLARDLHLLRFERGIGAFRSAASISCSSMRSSSRSSCSRTPCSAAAISVLHRLVFLVGLDLHQLALELAQAPLNNRQLLFYFAPGRLAHVDLCF